MNERLSIDWYLLLVFLGIVQALLLCFLLFIKSRKSGKRFRYLGLLIFSLALVLIGVFLDYSGYTEFSPNRQEVYLTLKDGGFGDADGIANGIIVDPLAFGSATDPNGSSGGTPLDDLFDGLIPSDLSCFISAAASPSTDSPSWNLWREIRGRELAIVFVAIFLLLAAKEIWRRRRDGS